MPPSNDVFIYLTDILQSGRKGAEDTDEQRRQKKKVSGVWRIWVSRDGAKMVFTGKRKSLGAC